MFKILFFLSFKNLSHRPLRSWLTIIGIVIGISVVVAIFFLGTGLERAVSGLLNQFGRGLIFVIPGELTDPSSRLLGKERIREKDTEVIKGVEGVDFVLPIIESKMMTGEFNGEKKLLSFQAQPWREMQIIFEQSQGFHLKEGYWPNGGSNREIVLGSKFAEKKFKMPIGLGDSIVVRGKRLKVAGIFSEIGEQSHDSGAYISLDGLKEITGEKYGFINVVVKAQEGANSDEVAENIKYTLSQQKGIGDFSVLTSEKAGKIAGEVIALLEFALAAIGGVALIVGGVGIMNAMYTAVLERTPEIGIMKALGAKEGFILWVFVFESGLMGIVGGAAGVILGGILAKAVEFFASQQGFNFLAVNFSFKIIVSILIFAFVIGVISGFLPARAAAKLKPVDALKYE